MPYPITRQFGPNAKGSELTFADMDNNLLYLDAKVTGSNGYVALFSGSNAVSSSVIYQNAGLIGINTTSPIVNFEVRGTSTGGKIRINNSLTTDYAELQFATGSESKAIVFVNGSAQSGYGGANSFNLWQVSDTAPMVFHTGTSVTERMRIDANGSVGIGVSSISSSVRLTIAGDGTGKAEIGPWSSGGNYTAISLNGNGNSIAGYNFLSSPTDYNLYVNRPTGASILFREGNSNQMVISSSGNVGIGTTSPNAKLDVNGNTIITGSLNITGGNINLTGNSGVNVSGDLNGGNIYSSRKIKIGDSTAPNRQLEITNSGSLAPTIRLNNTSSNSYYDIANTGNLFINRNASISGIVIASGSGGGSTVFTTSSITLETGVVETYTTTNFGAGTYNLTYNWNGGDDIKIFDGSSTGSIIYSEGYGTPPLTSSFTFTTTNGYITFQTEGLTTSQVIFSLITISSLSPNIRVGINKASGSSVNATGLDISGSLVVSGSTLITTLSGAGSRAVNADANGLLSATSDSRLKNKVEQDIPGLNIIKQIVPRAYTWKHIENGAVELGFFADEVAPLIPSAAPINNDGYYGFYDRSMLAVLVKGIQEQQVQIEMLQQQVNTLISGSK